MDRLRCMEAFVRVADAGAFSEAARRWGCSKGVVSKYVSQLEETVGIQLLQRSTRGIALTAAGERHYDRCREILGLMEQADAEAREAGNTPTGPLRVSAPSSFFSEGREEILGTFLERYPEITVSLAPTDRLVELVAERVDVAIRVTDPQDSSLIARKIAAVPFAVVASPEFLQEHGTPNSPVELESFPCFSDGGFGIPPRWAFLIDGEPVECVPQVRVMTGSPLLSRDLAVMGHGIALCPTFVVANAIAQGALVELWPKRLVATWGIYAVTTQRKYLPAHARVFIEHLRETIPDIL